MEDPFEDPSFTLAAANKAAQKHHTHAPMAYHDALGLGDFRPWTPPELPGSPRRETWSSPERRSALARLLRDCCRVLGREMEASRFYGRLQERKLEVGRVLPPLSHGRQVETWAGGSKSLCAAPWGRWREREEDGGNGAWRSELSTSCLSDQCVLSLNQILFFRLQILGCPWLTKLQTHADPVAS